jgi:hypothetical protein
MDIDDSMQDIWGPNTCTTGFSSWSGLSSRPLMVSSSLLLMTSIFVDEIRGEPGWTPYTEWVINLETSVRSPIVTG